MPRMITTTSSARRGRLLGWAALFLAFACSACGTFTVPADDLDPLPPWNISDLRDTTAYHIRRHAWYYIRRKYPLEKPSTEWMSAQIDLRMLLWYKVGDERGGEDIAWYWGHWIDIDGNERWAIAEMRRSGSTEKIDWQNFQWRPLVAYHSEYPNGQHWGGSRNFDHPPTSKDIYESVRLPFLLNATRLAGGYTDLGRATYRTQTWKLVTGEEPSLPIPGN